MRNLTSHRLPSILLVGGWVCLSFTGAAAAEFATVVDAAAAGDDTAALTLLGAGADPDLPGADGTTALMWAAYLDDVALAEALIKAGASVNLANQFGTFALREAALIGSETMVSMLLDAGADPNLATPEGESSLMVAARAGDVMAARRLLDAGAAVDAREQWGGQTALMWAAAQSQPAMIALLAEYGADPDLRGVTRQWERKVITEPRPKDMNKGGFTPLLYAAREGCVACARELIAAGADPDLADPERVTPLNMALLNLHYDFALYMIEAGADINKWDLFGRTPLYMAADTHTLPVMGNGAMVVLPSEDQATALDVGRALLAAGADPNIRLKRRPPYRNVPQDRGGDTILAQGATPLLRAARAGDAQFCELLLAGGALVDLPSKEGVTPLMAAAGVEFGLRVTRGRNRTNAEILATMEVLLDAGADINAAMVREPNQRVENSAAANAGRYSYAQRGRQVPSPHAVAHQTALHGAAMRGLTPVVEFLAARGANLDATDANGRTALDLARGDFAERFRTEVNEPHVETVEALERLLAAAQTASR